jgi:hypothetical protein
VGDFRKISFVHNALPDLSLGEVDTSFSIDGAKLMFPIVVLVESKGDAEKLSGKNKDIPVVAITNGMLDIYTDGVCKEIPEKGHKLIGVGDGLEAAKVVRTGGVPFIKEARLSDFQLYMRQFKIAMFLTNSKNTVMLGKAPIYIMG